MKEVKSPKKPLLYYYGIVLLIIALFNLLVTPLLNRRSIEEVDLRHVHEQDRGPADRKGRDRRR